MLNRTCHIRLHISHMCAYVEQNMWPFVGHICDKKNLEKIGESLKFVTKMKQTGRKI